MNKTLILLLSAILGLLTVSCVTRVTAIPVDLTPIEYFQKAQEAVAAWDDYNTALLYYRTFIERYPNDAERVVEAEYEIAFLHYKMKEYDTAETLLKELVRKYKEPGSETLPRWPYSLAEKILSEIEETRSTP
jgi:TolA-binding protein